MDSRYKETCDEIIPMESEGEEAAATKIQSVKKGDPDSMVAPQGEEDVAKSFESVEEDIPDSAVAPKKEEDKTRGIQSDKTGDSDSVVAPNREEDPAKRIDSGKHDSPNIAVAPEEQKNAAKRRLQSKTTEDPDPMTLPKRQQGSWCWLLAPDGTPSTIDFSFKKERTQEQNSDRPPNTKPKEPKKQGSWCWLLAPDGTPSTIDLSSAKKENSNTTPNTKPEKPKRQGSWCWLLAPNGSPAIVEPEAETVTGAHASGPNRNPVRTNWHWLLAPDGSPATVDLTTRGVDRKARSSQICKKRDQKQASWNWLLAPDGTPATASNSTTLRRSTTGKRSREDLSDGKEFASRPRRSRSHNSDFNYDDSTEDDDASSECSDFDESYIDGDRFSVCISKKYRMRWERNFQLLVEYKKKFKKTNVPIKHSKLGVWVAHQRYLYKTKRLPKYRRQRLESIKFIFDPLMERWVKMYNRLLLYKKQHGGATNVPIKFKDTKLALWVKTQRSVRKNLSKEKTELLESIGFQWKMRENDQRVADRSAWMEMYQRLLAYKQKYNNTRVPYHFKADPKLGSWVARQRHSCKEEERIDLLNYIGFEWDSNESDWMEMFRRLCAYREQYKNTLVPTRFKSDPKLGRWVLAQRHQCIKKNRVDLLNSIGFEWNPLDSDWMTMYQRLLAYQKQHKSTRVPQFFKEDPKLGPWVCTQRKHCARKDRVDLLNAIGFEWSCRID